MGVCVASPREAETARLKGVGGGEGFQRSQGSRCLPGQEQAPTVPGLVKPLTTPTAPRTLGADTGPTLGPALSGMCRSGGPSQPPLPTPQLVELQPGGGGEGEGPDVSAH